MGLIWSWWCIGDNGGVNDIYDGDEHNIVIIILMVMNDGDIVLWWWLWNR